MKDMLSIREASLLVHYTTQMILKMVKEGRIKGERIDGIWMVERPSLLDWASGKTRSAKKKPKPVFTWKTDFRKLCS